ncbi:MULTISPECIES: hypothetical protein [Halomicrobium]|nr:MULTISPECIES: hypothetical protein [Halomicrobium]
MRDHFEVGRYDAAGRLGELTVPRAGVTVDPRRDDDARRTPRFGPQRRTA